MKKIVLVKPIEVVPVIEFDRRTISRYNCYIAISGDKIGKLSYDHGNAHWNSLDRIDQSFDITIKDEDNSANAIQAALRAGFAVYEFTNLKELGQWLIANA